MPLVPVVVCRLKLCEPITSGVPLRGGDDLSVAALGDGDADQAGELLHQLIALVFDGAAILRPEPAEAAR